MWTVFESLLRDRGMTKADFSRATGIRETTISSWKTRGGRIGRKYQQTVADFFGVSLDYLTTGKKTGDPVQIKDPAIYLLIDAANGCDHEDIEQATALLRRLRAYKEALNVLTKDKDGQG